MTLSADAQAPDSHRPRTAGSPAARLAGLGALSIGTALLLSACEGDQRPDPDATAEQLAEALTTGDFSDLSAAEGDLESLSSGVETVHEPFGGTAPEVTVAGVEITEPEEDSVQPPRATVSLHHGWALDDLGAEGEVWEYETTAELVYAQEDEAWQLEPDTEMILPEFTGEQGPSVSSVAPERGKILDGEGRALVSDRAVYSIGIDKTQILADLQAQDDSVTGDDDGNDDGGPTEEQQREAASALAELVGIDASTFADQVVGHGDDAFVEATVHRADSDEITAAEVEEIPGAVAREESMSLPLDEDLAPALVGTVGPVTAENLEENPDLDPAALIGQSGVQASQEEVLSGEDGLRISMAGDTLYESEPTDGEDVQISLDPQIQRLAQQVVADVGQESSIVALRPSDGALLAAAGQGYVGPGLQHLYAPGSTFKVVTALTMLREGLTPDSTVECPSSTVVHGQQFNNVPGYPGSSVGSIPFHTAVADSCNTVFANNSTDVDAEQLNQAAADLGLAENEDFGLSVQMGSVPADSEANLLAADMLGQGVVQASPLGMATVMASVASGQTVQPHLVVPEGADEDSDDGDDEDGGGSGLSEEEADALTELLEGTVDVGTLDGMESFPGEHVYAKTGTAEVGSGDDMYAHTWVIAFQGDLAVAIFVEDGDFGSTTNGPILHDFLSGVHEIREG